MSKIRAKRFVSVVINNGTTNVLPTPFAGKYPTRIQWVVSVLGRGTFDYVGKPSRIAILRMLKLANHPQMQSITFMEVDKQNTLCSLYAERRNFADRRATFYAGWNVYHPFTSGVKGWEWALQPWWRKTLIDIPVYSPVETFSQRTHVEPYQQWYKGCIWMARDLRRVMYREEH